MKHILLPEKERYYRANLHCHSVMSDGVKTPEELKAFYQAHGYSILAITDHDLFVQHNDLTDENFLMLNGFEYEINGEGEDYPHVKTCHLCFLALDEKIDTTFCYHRTQYLFGNAPLYRDLIKYDESEPDYERVYSAECINEMIRRGREKGFFVTYNHPVWSCENYERYSTYEGMHAMEMVNYGCLQAGYEEENGAVYREMLNGGKKIFCIGADDNHNCGADDTIESDSFGAYIMVAAERLDYPSVAEALKKGRFYTGAGTALEKGPDIYSLVYEDGRVKIKTSAAKQIALQCATRSSRSVNAGGGEYVTEAEFEVRADEAWFRLIVRDEHGHKAYTNAYFLEDLK